LDTKRKTGAAGDAKTRQQTKADNEAKQAEAKKKEEKKDVNSPKSNKEIRQWYNDEVGKIPKLNEKWKNQGLSTKERAKKAYDIRHNARLKARSMMSNKDEVLALQKRDLKKYKNPDGPTFEQLVEKFENDLTGDDIFEAIIGGSKRTDATYNKNLSVKGD